MMVDEDVLRVVNVNRKQGSLDLRTRRMQSFRP